MVTSAWLNVPIGVDADRWITRGDCRCVLAVVHTVTSGQRVLEVVELLERDPRVQFVFTQAPDVFSNGVADFLRDTGGLVLTWEQAVRERFDLAVAASYGGLPQVHAPVMVLPHGAGYGKGYPVATAAGQPERAAVYGLEAQRLMHNGQLVVDAVVLPHEDELAVLRAQCPPAVPAAVVAGDVCFDRLVASLPHRADYRAELGIAPGERLVVVASTWGRDSLFGRQELLTRLLDELSGCGVRVAALVHPSVWFGHGPRTVAAWTADCRDAGLILVGPEHWQAPLVAADHVVGDHGSVSVYAAAIGRPVLLVDPPPRAVIPPGSAQDVVHRLAPRLRVAEPIGPQLRAAESGVERLRAAVAGRLTSRPGTSAVVLRETAYRLLGLDVPGRHRELTPVPAARGWRR